ncbi:hypothetical protein Hanom_Chr17g01590201 [Helianthus anomalus]
MTAATASGRPTSRCGGGYILGLLSWLELCSGSRFGFGSSQVVNVVICVGTVRVLVRFKSRFSLDVRVNSVGYSSQTRVNSGQHSQTSQWLGSTFGLGSGSKLVNRFTWFNGCGFWIGSGRGSWFGSTWSNRVN